MPAKKTKKETPVLKDFFFPKQGVTIKAESIEEAKKILSSKTK